MEHAWTKEWPQEPGLYLFYGGDGRPDDPGFSCRMSLCRARWARSGDVRYLQLKTDQGHLNQDEQSGVFCRLMVPEPDWPIPGEDTTPIHGLSEHDRTALYHMFCWRDANTDRWGDDLECHLNDFFYTASPAQVPERHQAALSVFQGLSNMQQGTVVRWYCDNFDSTRRKKSP